MEHVKGEHSYSLKIEWTGNLGQGTSGYRAYNRNHTIQSDGKPTIEGSSDPSFLGDKARYNPEELLVASLSSCHMLWFLHLCADEGIIVHTYEDQANGTMIEAGNGSGKFREVVLNPVVTIGDESQIAKAELLHAAANKLCFIANSVNFPIRHRPVTRVRT